MRNILILVFLIASLPSYSQIQKSFPAGNPIVGSELETNFTEIENRLEGFVQIAGSTSINDESATTIASVTLTPGIWSLHGTVVYDRQGSSSDAILDMYTYIDDDTNGNSALGNTSNVTLLSGPSGVGGTLSVCHRLNYNVGYSLSDVRSPCSGYLINVTNTTTIYVRSYVNYGPEGSEAANGWDVYFEGYAKRH